MKIVFIVLALSLLLIYSPYLLGMFRGQVEIFEQRLQAELATVLKLGLEHPWRTMLPLLVVGLLFEAGYFWSALIAVGLTGYTTLTIYCIIFEIYHIGRAALNLLRFMKGTIKSEEFVIWRLERTAALLLSLHALVGLILTVAAF